MAIDGNEDLRAYNDDASDRADARIALDDWHADDDVLELNQRFPRDSAHKRATAPNFDLVLLLQTQRDKLTEALLKIARLQVIDPFTTKLDCPHAVAAIAEFALTELVRGNRL